MLRSGGNFRLSRETYGLDTGPDGPTIQSAKDESDINVMVRRFGITGVISGVQMPPPLTEFAETFDFQSSMNVIRRAQESFSSMSAETRAEFNNDPARFVRFCSDKDKKGGLKNLERMREMGLAVPEKMADPIPPPLKVEVVNPVPVK